ncbi:MAG: molybdopterin cofactor-binding domain-containing protein [Gemmatimonadota bacterium]
MTGPAAEKGGVSRRTFIRIVGVAGAGLTLGISYRALRGPPPLEVDADFAPNAFLRIDADGAVTVVLPRSEMGQGVSTSLPQLLAEELDVGLERVAFVFAPAHEEYRVSEMGMQVTGGSTSVLESWEPFRRAGATARRMLLEAAARRWRVDAEGLGTENGRVVDPSDGRALDYGELAVEAAGLDVPDDVPLKDPATFRLIGSSVPRLDAPVKTTGAAVFGLDAGPREAAVAVVARCPVFGGRVRSFDPGSALAVPGVRRVVELEGGVAVVADGYWEAQKGRNALVVEWDEGPWAALDDAEIRRRFADALEGDGGVVRDDGDADAALAAGGTVLRATYAFPYLAHATMEPMNCTAVVADGRCTVWAPTQFQDGPAYAGGGSRQVAARKAGVDADDTTVYTTFLGGGFGRRAEVDFVEEAAELAAKVDGPVKVVWSREDDMRHDFYRPAALHRIAAAVGTDGRPLAWKHEIASQSILDLKVPRWIPRAALRLMGMMPEGVDPTTVEGAADPPYRVPAVRVRGAQVNLPIPVGFWRSVGHSHNAFVVESFVDELAHAAGADPVAYRMALLDHDRRERGVLRAVAQAADWDGPVPEGRARGVAVHASFGSFVAQVAEVSVGEAGRPRVHRVWCAVDCGTVVNPAIVKAQMESGIIYGLTAALYGRINIRGGRAVQSNFHDYPMVRMNEAPEIEVVLAPSGDPPGGIGEPGVPPIAPAMANALFALTGERARELPLVVAPSSFIPRISPRSGPGDGRFPPGESTAPAP